MRKLITGSDPLVISANHENLWSSLSASPMDMDRLREAIDAVNTVYEELQERVDMGLGVVEKGAPRILAILPDHSTDPRLEYFISEMGIAIAARDNGITMPEVNYLHGSEDPYIEMAMPFVTRSLSTIPAKRVPLIIERCKKLNIDGVYDRFHAGCRSTVGDSIVIRNAVKDELGVPVLFSQWENFDPRANNDESYRGKWELFKTMMIKKHDSQ